MNEYIQSSVKGFYEPASVKKRCRLYYHSLSWSLYLCTEGIQDICSFSFCQKCKKLWSSTNCLFYELALWQIVFSTKCLCDELSFRLIGIRPVVILSVIFRPPVRLPSPGAWPVFHCSNEELRNLKLAEFLYIYTFIYIYKYLYIY